MLPSDEGTLRSLLFSIRERGLPESAEAKIVRVMTRLGYTVPPRQA